MMKYLHPEIPWGEIKAIGFDMDGTLYDEFEFIHPVYDSIAALFQEQSNSSKADISTFMLSRWLEKGSSYPYIYEETLEKLNISGDLRKSLIEEALKLFRNFKPDIKLSARMCFLLEELKKNYALFVVSDGSTTLQWNKVESLNLEKYFEKKHIFISGDHGKDMGKPGIGSKKYLENFFKNIMDDEIVYIGDRSVDQQYAENAGFHFLSVHSLFNHAK